MLLHQGDGIISNKHDLTTLSGRVDLGAPFDDALPSASKDAIYDASNYIYDDANIVYEDFGGTRSDTLTLKHVLCCCYYCL